MRTTDPPTDCPTYPPRVRWWSSLRAGIAGRRDARSAAAPDRDGHLPFTHRLAAITQAGHTLNGAWLHVHIEPLDCGIAQAAESIADSRRVLARTEARLADEQAMISARGVPDDEAIRHAREAARLRKTLDVQQHRASQASTTLAQLVTTRRHTIDAARTAAAAWQATYNRLTSCHRRGYLRRSPKATAETPQVPRFSPYLKWTSGDMPLLVAVIDPDAREIIDLAMKPFDDRTIVTDQPPRSDTT